MRAQELIYWIDEREQMLLRKKDSPVPRWRYGWSDDPHMGTVSYCNVHREDDKVTKYIAEHWRTADMPASRMVLARMVNYIPTLEKIRPFVDDLEQVGRIMKDTRTAGEKIWTAAYTISTCGQSMDKVDYMLGVVRGSAALAGAPIPSTLAGAHAALQGVKGLGSFLAAQVVADLKNTPGSALHTAPDWWTWAAHGPGSLAGLSAYFGMPVTPRIFATTLNTCWSEVKHAVPPLHMQDFQNCMCEFSKYVRVKEGGHARNRYAAG